MTPEIYAAIRERAIFGKALRDQVLPVLDEALRDVRGRLVIELTDRTSAFDPVGDRGPEYPTIYLEAGTRPERAMWKIESRHAGTVTTGKFGYGPTFPWATGTMRTLALADFTATEIRGFVDRIVAETLGMSDSRKRG